MPFRYQVAVGQSFRFHRDRIVYYHHSTLVNSHGTVEYYARDNETGKLLLTYDAMASVIILEDAR